MVNKTLKETLPVIFLFFFFSFSNAYDFFHLGIILSAHGLYGERTWARKLHSTEGTIGGQCPNCKETAAFYCLQALLFTVFATSVIL